MSDKKRVGLNRILFGRHNNSELDARGRLKPRIRGLQHCRSQIYKASVSQKFIVRDKRGSQCEESLPLSGLQLQSPKVFAEFFEKRSKGIDREQGRVACGSAREQSPLSIRECLQRKILENVKLHRKVAERLPKIKQPKKDQPKEVKVQSFAVWSVKEKEEMMGYSIGQVSQPRLCYKRIKTEHLAIPQQSIPRKTFFRDFTPWSEKKHEELINDEP